MTGKEREDLDLIFYEPVNLKQWNMFEKVSGVGHIEPFLATKAMKIGDIILLHVGAQDKQYESGVYAYGTVVKGPYILEDHPEDYCNGKNSVDVSIKKIVYGHPLISHEGFKKYNKQFRTVHKIDECWYDEIMDMLK